MVLPTGAISFLNLNVELQRPNNPPISLNDAQVRQMAVKPSGAISMNDLRGKSFFSVSGGNTLASGSNGRLNPGVVTTTTNSVSCGTITGGTAPYTYAWEYVSGDAAATNSPNSASTTFSRSVSVSYGDSITRLGVYRCKITDANNLVIYGPNCTVATYHNENS